MSSRSHLPASIFIKQAVFKCLSLRQINISHCLSAQSGAINRQLPCCVIGAHIQRLMMDLIQIFIAVLSWNLCLSRRVPLLQKTDHRVKNRYFHAIQKHDWLNEELSLSPDYDVIEVIHNTSTGLMDNEIEFVATKGRSCASHCVRGLSGLCICPPPLTPFSPYSHSDPMHHNVSWSPTPSDSLTLSGHRTHISNLKYPTLHKHPNHPVRRRLRYNRMKREDEDEDDQKLCKCRHCRKLFKRTLYCRVFPCYQKKCKSGEWKEH